jgi:alpha-1,2-mannosyltransferase
MSSQAPPASRVDPLDGRRRRIVLGVLAVLTTVAFVVWIRKAGDFAGYLAVGRLVLAGGDIYRDAPPGVNTWPPFFSLVCVPLALLARPTVYLARGVWIALNLGVLWLVLRLIARLVYGRELRLAPDGAALSLASPEILVPLLCTGRYVMSNFEHLQVSLFLFALTLGGLRLATTGRAAAGGPLLGLAAAIKVMPIVFVPYLAYRGRWRAAGAAALATAAFSLSPVPVFGWERFRQYVAAWRAMVAAGWPVGPPNQSVFAMWDRFIGHAMAPFTVGGIDQLPTSGDPAVVRAVAVTLAVVAVLAAWAFRGRPRSDSWAILAEWSAVFIVSALFGPVAWKHYLVALLLPNTLLFAVWRRSDLPAPVRRAAGGVLLGALLVGGLTAPGFLGMGIAERLEMASVITVSSLAILGAMLWLRPRLLGEVGRPAPAS